MWERKSCSPPTDAAPKPAPWKASQNDDETKDRLKVLQEKGWDAFKTERDANYHGRSVEEEKQAREGK